MMKKGVLVALLFSVPVAGYAQSAVSTQTQTTGMALQDWSQMDSMSRWKTLSEQDRIDSVEAYIARNKNAAAFGKSFEYKVRNCLDKEVEDPDYRSIRVPLMLPMSYCMMKYTSIFQAKKFGS